MKELSTERAIEALYTIRAYYASLTAGYPKGKDCRGIGDVMCSEIANSCLMAIKALEQTEPERKGREEFEDLKDFVSDIIAIHMNYNNANPYEPYCPKDLEVDFDYVMEKWSKKIEHYKWGKRNDNTCN